MTMSTTRFEPGNALMGQVDVAGSALGDDELFDDLSDIFIVSADLATFAVLRDEFTTVVGAGVGGGQRTAAAATWTRPGNGGSTDSAIWSALSGVWGRF